MKEILQKIYEILEKLIEDREPVFKDRMTTARLENIKGYTLTPLLKELRDLLDEIEWIEEHYADLKKE